MTGEALCTKVNELAVKYGQTPKEAMPVIKDDGTVEFIEGVPYLVLIGRNLWKSQEMPLSVKIRMLWKFP